MKKVFLSLIIITAVATIAELALRNKGFKPYEKNVARITIQPKMMYVFDSLLGHKLLPGNFTITDESGTWHTTNNAQGWRITRKPGELDTLNEKSPSLILFGGASTYGQFLDDTETFAYQLQQKLPTINVINYTAPGYGLVHAYTLLKTKQATLKPGDIVFYTYFTAQDHRPNRQLEKEMYASIQAGLLTNYHYTKLNESLTPVLIKYNYHLWPLNQYLAVINFAEDSYNAYLDKKENTNDIARKAIVEMNKLCKEKGARFILNIRRANDLTLKTAAYCKQNGVEVLDLSAINIVSADDAPNPHPGEHLNATPNRLFADTIYNYIKK